ncbi:MAG: GTPase domain-containing protein [Deltaproteobacteria bacterium]|jgi:signal recognition particle receptor subunit beta|nr:GTPase domain-containing protein [Deltaproteobacteria bacterium]
MSIINLKKREVECKIVYYGPGRGGKTSNLQYVFQKSRQLMSDEMVSIKTKGDLTLFFDFVPMGVGKIKGCDVRVQLYTVPGQVKYSSTRKLVLKGVDGLVFVADSLKIRHEKNILSLKDLALNLQSYGLNIMQIPLILQYNKRDLAAEGVPLMSVEEMERAYNHQLKVPSFAASAVTGQNVNATLKACLVATLRSLKKEAGW